MGQITIKTDLPIYRDYIIDDDAQAIEIINLLNKKVGYMEIQNPADAEKLEDAQDVADAIKAMTEKGDNISWEYIKAECGL